MSTRPIRDALLRGTPQVARISDPNRLEVHDHYDLAAERERMPYRDFEHSHADGSVAHRHPDTGPARFVIDKDEWYAVTGLAGGGRKRYTAEPSGRTLPFQGEPDRAFTVIVHEESLRRWHAEHPGGATGGGEYATARMVLAFDLEPVVEREP